MIDKLLMTLTFLLADETLSLPLVKEFDRGWRGEAPWG